MAVEETKEYTPEEAQFWEDVAQAEEQFGSDTFCPYPARHRQRWQHRKDKLLLELAEAKDSSVRENLHQKLIELEQAWERSAKALAYLVELNKLNI